MAAGMLLAIYLLSREGAVMAAKEQVGSAVIVIDSGHGGIDPGVVGIDGLEEKGINLKIAGYLGWYLEKEGFRVVFTREDDRGLYEEDSPNKKNQDLRNRCALIRRLRLSLPSVSIRTVIRIRVSADLRCFIILVLKREKNWQNAYRKH